MLTTSPWKRWPIGYLLDVLLPRARRLVLEREGDLLLLAVDVEDVDLQRLVDLHDVARLVAMPAHVGDVEQAVDAAQVDERGELGDVLDDAVADLADLELGEELVLLDLAAVLGQLAARDDDVAALARRS